MLSIAVQGKYGRSFMPMRLDYLFRAFLTTISPKLNAFIVYAVKKHRIIHWKNPQTFVEKLLKLRITDYNYNPLVKQCADKYAVRSYVEEHGYGFLLNDLLAVYDRPEDIVWDDLPDRFAMKLNFACTYNIICQDKSKLDREKTAEQLRVWMRQKPWLGYAELQYKDVTLKIIVEKFLEGKNGLFPEDYKLYCFHGEPKAILYMSGRYSDHMMVGFFDTDWNYLGSTQKAYEGFDRDNLPEKPASLRMMLEAAKALSKPFPFVRMDFYDLDGTAIFGEMTFSPAGSFDVSEIDVHGESMKDMLHLER
jgi:hypothetical protein